MTPATPTAAGVSVEASLRDQIKNLERIKKDLQTRLFKALETEPTLTAALREVDHTPSGSLSRGLYSDVLDIACVHIAKVKELEAALLASAAGGGETRDLRTALEPYAKFGFADKAHNEFARRVFFGGPRAEYPECSGDPSSCPENEGRGCCAAPPPPVGELQGVSEAIRKLAEIERGLMVDPPHAMQFAEVADQLRGIRESFAASRPVAGMDKLISRLWLDDMADDAEPVEIVVYGDEKNLKRLQAYLENPRFKEDATPPSTALTTPKMTIAEAVAVALVKMPRSRLAFADSGELLEFAEHIGAAVAHVVAAPQAAVDAEKIMEQIARQWDGCMCDIAAVGEVDIGEAIRSDWKEYSRLATGEGKTS